MWRRILSGKLLRKQLGPMVDKLANALLPPDTLAFVAGAARLILSPHRRLHLVPFHAARIGGKYLIEQAAIRYVPSRQPGDPWQGVRDGDVMAVGINDFGNRMPALHGAEAEAEAVVSVWGAAGRRLRCWKVRRRHGRRSRRCRSIAADFCIWRRMGSAFTIRG